MVNKRLSHMKTVVITSKGRGTMPEEQTETPPADNTPATPPTNPPQQTHQQSSVDLSPLMTQLQALPEQITNAVKEAVTPPKVTQPRQTSSPSQNSSATQPTGGSASTKDTPPASTPGKRKSFSDWWFNG